MDLPEDPRIGAILADRYRLLACVAAGGMGVVYRGERVQLGRPVAVKFLHPGFAASPELRRRFEVEARAMSRLAHPNCGAVIDFGVHEGTPYIVMDYVGGRTLRELLDEAPVPLARTLGVVRQLLAGLAHAHEQGIVHRDVKPENLVLAELTGTGDHLRILDFGLAKLNDFSGHLSQSQIAIGTPSYMSPEQARGEPTDVRSDIYAVGVVLFELLTRRKPFVAEDPLVLLGLQRDAAPPRLREVASGAGFSAQLEAVVDKALAKDPAARHQTAADFARELEATPEGSGRPMLPAPPSVALAPTLVAPNALVASAARAAEVPAARAAATSVPPRAEAAAEPSIPVLASSELELEPSLVSASPATSSPGVEQGHDLDVEPPRRRARGVRTSLALLLLLVLGGTGWLVYQNGGLHLGPFDPRTVDGGTALPRGPSGPVAPSSADRAAPSVPAARGERAPSSAVVEPPTAPAVAAAADAAAPTSPPAAAPSPPGPDGGLAAAAGPADGAADDSGQTAEERADPVPPVPAVPVVEDTIDPPARPAPKPAQAEAPPVRTLAQVKALITAGRTDDAIAGLLTLRRESPRKAYLWYLLGSLYFDKHYWSDGLDSYRATIHLSDGYRKRAVLIRNTVRALGSDKTHAKAAALLRNDIGVAATPYLKQAARDDRDPKVRARAQRLLKAGSLPSHVAPARKATPSPARAPKRSKPRR